jgi:hypothetical protein
MQPFGPALEQPAKQGPEAALLEEKDRELKLLLRR